MAEIIAHRGVWTKEEEQNSLRAVDSAICNGFGVEIDIRFKPGLGLCLGHDAVSDVSLRDALNVIVNNDSYHGNQVIFHMKEWMSPTILKREISDFDHIINYKIIGVSKLFDDYCNVFGAGKVIREIENLEDYCNEIDKRGGSVWVAEIFPEKLNKELLTALKLKKNYVYYVTPECFSTDLELIFTRTLMAKEGMFDAVCTDKPLEFQKIFKNGSN